MIEVTITASALIVLVLLLRVLLKWKVTARVQYALWAVVLIRLLLPVSLFSSSISVLRWMPEPEAAPVTQSQQAPSNSVVTTVPVLPSGQTLPSDPVIRAEGSDLPVSPAPSWQFEPRYVLYIGWAVAGAWMLLTNLRFWRNLRRDSVPVELEGVPLPVRQCASLSTPCLFGLLHPTIYLTPDCLEDETKLSHVLAHEYTHYRHGDHLWAALRCLCLVLHWFNPLVWAAAVLSRRDCELACDEGALARLGEEERTAYGRTLLSMATSTGSSPLRAATTMNLGKRSLRERIVLIANRPKMTVLTLLVVLLVLALAVGCTFSSPTETETNDVSVADGVEAPEDVLAIARQEAAEKVLSSATEGEPFTEAVILDREITELTLAARYESMADYPIEVWYLDYRLLAEEPENLVLAGSYGLDEENWCVGLYTDLIIGYEDGTAKLLCSTRFDFSDTEAMTREALEYAGVLTAPTYPGHHVAAEVTLVNNDHWTLILSQPVTQGDTGIWCVERAYDGSGGTYYFTGIDPETESADYYAALQAECDAGHRPGLLDPEDVARTYLSEVWGWSGSTVAQLELVSGVTDAEVLTASAAAEKAIGTAEEPDFDRPEALLSAEVDVWLHIPLSDRDFWYAVKSGRLTELLEDYVWEAVPDRQAPSQGDGIPLILQPKEINESYLQFCEDSDLVLFRSKEKETWYQITPKESDASSAASQLFALLYDAEYKINRSRITVDADGRSAEAIATDFADRFAKMHMELLPGSPYAVTSAQIAGLDVYDTSEYAICFELTLVLEPVEPNSIVWMAGAGIEPFTDGPWAGKWKWTRQINLVKDGNLWCFVELGSGGIQAEDAYLWPVEKYYTLSTLFGGRVHPLTGTASDHTGIDIVAPEGTPVLAARDGMVIIEDFSATDGNYLVIQHTDGTSALYAHLKDYAVPAGTTVQTGQVIGSVGSTGASTGSHLHFEVRDADSNPVDPLNYYDLNALSLYVQSGDQTAPLID